MRDRDYAILTPHRPGNVDRRDPLLEILEAARRIAETMPVVFPVHPRTRARIAEFGLAARLDGLLGTEPLGLDRQEPDHLLGVLARRLHRDPS